MAEYTPHPSASQLGDAPLSRTPTGGPVSIEQSLRRHEGLIHAIIIRREGSGSLTYYEEALQAGRIGLWRAILGYDPAWGIAFSTYAWVALRRHMRRTATQVADDTGCRLMPHPPRQAPDLDEIVERTLVHETLFALLSQLPDRLRQVVRARYSLDGHSPRSLRQLGAQLGLSHERIRQLEQEALAWLRHPVHSLPLRQLLDKNTAVASPSGAVPKLASALTPTAPSAWPMKSPKTARPGRNSTTAATLPRAATASRSGWG